MFGTKQWYFNLFFCDAYATTVLLFNCQGQTVSTFACFHFYCIRSPWLYAAISNRQLVGLEYIWKAALKRRTLIYSARVCGLAYCRRCFRETFEIVSEKGIFQWRGRLLLIYITRWGFVQRRNNFRWRSYLNAVISLKGSANAEPCSCWDCERNLFFFPRTACIYC